jgi:hypothetical protein
MSRASARVGIVTRSPGAQLLGRQTEREVLGRLLEAARGDRDDHRPDAGVLGLAHGTSQIQ